ncbi:hypothetical protein BDQ12DRAFT_673666 [Crucibulum laeve]|uniref:Uncharacterized protein n=1 Tax=Crucibulum laeve TaxID=68775 RepID=A0A5C3MTX5_9AGAR|nr:hypothetical protein BDQ12DRAFT_673666 [Crucibulum laeve]
MEHDPIHHHAVSQPFGSLKIFSNLYRAFLPISGATRCPSRLPMLSPAHLPLHAPLPYCLAIFALSPHFFVRKSIHVETRAKIHLSVSPLLTPLAPPF